ncbi:MAG: GNAT family N-acetyltransferase [Beijerinckiaceae bacterium]
MIARASDCVALGRLERRDADIVAHIHRVAFDERMPWLKGLHTPDEDVAYFSDQVFHGCEVWGARLAVELVGFIAFRDGWIEHLYVLPTAQKRGAGGSLLKLAQEKFSALKLWTFQRNDGARRFYENRGFVALRETDGVGNAEKEPDVLYGWERVAAS